MSKPIIGVTAGIHDNFFSLFPTIQLEAFDTDDAHGMTITFRIFCFYVGAYVGWDDGDDADEDQGDGQ